MSPQQDHLDHGDGYPDGEEVPEGSELVAGEVPGEELAMFDEQCRIMRASVGIEKATNGEGADPEDADEAPDIRQVPLQDPEPDPVVYVPHRIESPRSGVLILRALGDPADVTALVRDTMRILEPDLPLFNIQTMDQQLARQRWPFRVFGSMFATFALIALVLSGVGLYAVTAYSVTQRTLEIGLRVALGARPGQVQWFILRLALWQLAIGLLIGVAGALGVGQLLQSLLVQTSPTDPTTLVSIVALLMSVAVLACLWPARLAARLDPMEALRYD